ncbi:MAG: xanthine dehydrogenase family protein subunit M [Anaerolineae bacterium]|nr:xanthine dehydrogenase family protein subunit M [Thermoflexales bacterium]MDW8408320.1 xanthine dehydrogenase family protein subunit M [Anaerolineae bacterium]
MQAFEYVAATSVTQAVSLLKERGEQARVLSGGTDLLVQLKEGRRYASLLIDIKPIPEVNELSYSPETGLRIGAAVPCFHLSNQAAIRQAYPGLIDAVALIGGVQIQGRATLGGNLSNASPAADSIPALIVHHAVCDIAGPAGRRELAVERFCTAPGKNALDVGEFLVAIRVPPPPAHFGAAYLRFIPRNEMDIAVVGAAASVTLNKQGDIILSGRIALGAVAPTPLLAEEAGAALAGRPADAEMIEQVARIAQHAARPITDMRGTAAQRKHLAYVLTRRVLEHAIERARTTT